MHGQDPLARALAALVLLALLPTLAAAQCLDWRQGFGLPGTDEDVFASVTYDDGLGGGPMLIVGGQFRVAGEALTDGIARWNGSEWEALGQGLGDAAQPSVHALAVHDEGAGPVLFAGGRFQVAGGLPVANIVRWDGLSWSALGGGLDMTVQALAVFDDGLGGGPCLYAGGNSATPSRRLQRWDGSTWTPVGGNIQTVDGNGDVTALAVHDDGSGPALYVGGDFTSVGGLPAANIARWDGTAWTALGSGTGNSVWALAVHDDGSGPGLYAGGTFRTAGGSSALHVARWNGASWSPLGAGSSSAVQALAVHDDGSGPALYAGGQFKLAGGIAAAGIAQWRNSTWSPVGSGLEGSVLTLSRFDPGSPAVPLLVAGGTFNGSGSSAAPQVAAWDGRDWAGLGDGQGLGGRGVNTLAVFDDGSGGGPALYAGGQIEAAGAAFTGEDGLARWDGSGWARVPHHPYLDHAPRSLAVFDAGTGPRLFVGYTHGVAAWDGSAWDPGQQVMVYPGNADALAVHDDGSGAALYIGGEFDHGCSSGLRGILRWDGTSCSAVGGGLDYVHDLIEFDDGTGVALYAGGHTYPIPAPTGFVARWDGSQWTHLGSGMDRPVFALAVYDAGGGPRLFAGGSFTTADGQPIVGIARWNGATWEPIGSGPVGGLVGGSVFTLAVHDDGTGGGPALYAGGNFVAMDGVPAVSVARWDGTSWNALGLGIDDPSGYPGVSALLSFDDGSGAKLWAAGDFLTAGGHVSSAIAAWGDACGCTGTTYCSAKQSSLGCLPSVNVSGVTNLSDPQPLEVSAGQVLNGKPALLFYGTSGADAKPLLGGTLCVRAPLKRTAPQWSGGSAPPTADCTGRLAVDFKAYALSGADPGLVAGVSVYAQYWYRDPADTHGVGLTDAATFTFCP